MKILSLVPEICEYHCIRGNKNVDFIKYSKLPLLRPPLGLAKTSPISGVVLLLNIKL